MAISGYGRVSTAVKQSTTGDSRSGAPASGRILAAAQRPRFKESLGKFAFKDTPVVAKPDRLGRDAQDVLWRIKLLASAKSKSSRASSVAAVWFAGGKLMLAVAAEMKHDLLVERTQTGFARAKAEGRVLGRPPNAWTKRQRQRAWRGVSTCPEPRFRPWSLSRSQNDEYRFRLRAAQGTTCIRALK
jgi:putative DNA-invertase from lambdoid prophage Rac